MSVVEDKVIYKTVGGVDLTMYMFRPAEEDPAELLAGIVFFHGGGWMGGEPQQFFQQSRYLAERGMLAASAEYRLIEKHGTTPFECVADGKSAIRWLREHAEELAIDPERVAAGGGSAGGHVAASAAVLPGFDEEGENRDVSSRPNAMVLFNPVLDTTLSGWQSGARMLDRRARELSPMHHIEAGVPPCLILHGQDDDTVPYENAERFCRRMQEAENRCELVGYEGEGHGFFNVGRDDGTGPFLQTIREADAFLRSLGYLHDASS
jgi:acetyl esterase/lipase